MKRKQIQLIAIYMSVALCGQVALCQSTNNSQTRSTEPTTTQSAGSIGDTPFSKLHGADVKGPNGESLGKLVDVILNPQSGKVTFAALSKGGVLKLAGRRLLVPWQNITMNSQQQLVLNLDQQKLASAPTVAPDYSDLTPQEMAKVYSYYGIQPSGVGAPGAMPGGTESGQGKAQNSLPQK